PPSYYWETFTTQREIFGDRPVKNVVQTNLTVLDDDRLELLAKGFDTVGVSIDMVGGLRANIAGKDSQARVLDNIERLRERAIPFGAIVVMTRRNLRQITKISDIFAELGVPLRVLPLFDGAFTDQHHSYEIRTEDIVAGFSALFDRWLTSDRRASVVPTAEHAGIVLRHILGRGQRPPYDKRRWLPVLLIDTNGDCYCYGDPYEDPEWCLGNLFTSSLEEVLASAAFKRSARAAEQRIQSNCTECAYFGSCNGYPIAEEHYNCNETHDDSQRTCVVERTLFEYMERRMREYDLSALEQWSGGDSP
ncbi:MAG: radical SAM protein, partial [Myxococcota bacterium]